MDFKKLCKEAFEISKLRKQGDALKHCGGELVEAVESRTIYLYEHSKDKESNYKSELADIVICAMSAFAKDFPDEDFSERIENKVLLNKKRVGFGC